MSAITGWLWLNSRSLTGVSPLTQAIQAIMSMDKTDGYIDRVQHLLPAPTVATKLLGLFSDPNRDIDEIVELISHEPALTAEVLKRCNSAFFGGAEPASDMFEAITRLGFYEVYCVVVALVSARAMSLGKGEGGLDAGRLWRHSVMTAVTAAELAKCTEGADAVAFTAGLLHDVGRLVFASVEEMAYADLVRQAGPFGPALIRAEESAFGVTHASVGARLLNRWGLPANVVVAVLYHHDAPKAAKPFEQLAATIHLANTLAHHIADGAPTASAPPACNPDAMALLELTVQHVPRIIEQAQASLRRVHGLHTMIS